MQSASLSLADVQRYISYTGAILQLISALMLALVFRLALPHARRERHVVAWRWAWIVLALAMSAIVVRFNIGSNPDFASTTDNQVLVRGLHLFHQAGRLLFYVLLLAGCLYYARGTLPRWFSPVTAAGGAPLLIASAGYISDLNQLVNLQAPAALLSGLVCSGLLFRLPRSRRSPGSIALGSVFLFTTLLWTLYLAASRATGPLLTDHLSRVFDLLVRYNSFFDAGSHVALGFATLLLLQEDARREVDCVYGELSVGLDPRRRLALHDSVTGSMNQRAFQKGLGLEAARATIGTVVAVDINQLKSVNDAHGHAAGDALLRHLVEVLRGALRVSDKLYRWGGDEFLLVLPHAQPARVRQRLTELLDNSPDLYPSAVQSIRLNVSIGVAEYAGAEDLPAAIEQANLDQQRAKHARKDHPAGTISAVSPLTPAR